MTTSTPPGQADIDWSALPPEARTELAAAYERVCDLIDEIGARDPQAGLDACKQLSRLAKSWETDQVPRKALFAYAIRERDKLSLAELAVKIDGSKALAARMIDQANDLRAAASTAPTS